MNSSDYRSAMEKVEPGEAWREKTLEAMRAAQEPEKKTLRRSAKKMHRAALSAAAVLMLAVVPVLMHPNTKRQADAAPARQDTSERVRMEQESTDSEPINQNQPAQPQPAQDMQPEKGGAALFSARSMMDMAGNPTQMLANDALPEQLPVFAVTQSEEEMKQALDQAAKALGQTMKDFAYDAQEKSAVAAAGDYRLAMHRQRVNITREHGVLAQAPQDMTPEEKGMYYCDALAANICGFESPAMQTEPSETDFRLTVFEAKEGSAAQQLVQYSFCRVELTMDAQNDALLSLAYPVHPQTVETMQVIGAEQAMQAGNAADACAREIQYRLKGDTLRPYYRFIFSDASEVFVPALAADAAEGME